MVPLAVDERARTLVSPTGLVVYHAVDTVVSSLWTKAECRLSHLRGFDDAS